jgi:signal transduction histidine kinase
VRVVVVNSAGEAVVGPTFEVGEDFTNRPEIMGALSGNPVTGERVSTTLRSDLFYVSVPVISGEATVGAVRITAPASMISGAVNARLAGLLAVAFISILIAVIAAFALAGAFTRPIKKLTDTSERLADGDLGDRADETSGAPEVRVLARSYNSMVNRLEGMLERQRGFAGAASHQLRTPLTALRLRLESAAVVDGEEQAAHIEAAVTEIDRLSRIIEGLLLLSRAEGQQVKRELVELRSVVERRCDYWEPLLAERGIALEFVCDADSVDVVAIPTAVEQCVDNFIDNAIEVVGEGSTILVRVVRSPGSGEVHVVDDGPGLSQVDRDDAFGRFWRAKAANPGGTGLGLAIVRQFAESSGGSAELRLAPTGGIDAVVTFPRV